MTESIVYVVASQAGNLLDSISSLIILRHPDLYVAFPHLIVHRKHCFVFVFCNKI